MYAASVAFLAAFCCDVRTGKRALDLARLSREEQFELLDQLWETLGRDPLALPLSDTQRAELDRRLDDLDTEGPVGLTCNEVVAQARAR
jgi:putative addiction module component (TIGR02574 family)